MKEPIFKRGWNLYIDLFWLLATKYSVVIVWFVGLYFVISLLTDYDKDTTSITNGAFALIATLAALTFSYARTIDKDDHAKDRLIFVGERFFHSCILFLTASILKYGYLSLIKTGIYLSHSCPKFYLSFIIGTTVSLLFFFGFNSAHTGFRILNNLLWSKMARHKDWDKLT